MMARMRSAIVMATAVIVAGCHGEKTGTIAGPPLTVAPSTPPPVAPPSATFQELTSAGIDLALAACQAVIVTPVTGTAAFANERLAPGDVMAVRGLPEHGARLTGQGLAVVAMMHDADCVTRSRVVRATRAPELAFMGGAMRAHLDIDDREIAPFYLGRLSGTAGVPEHSHGSSWEILCAVEASGRFTLDGKKSPLGARTCVAMPPGVKHSWRPDAGSNLVAVQMYAPPGPEQRFKKLAAEEAVRDR
jgi:mannose-6-phosphate isomerase-like protein (cupin superfamily)